MLPTLKIIKHLFSMCNLLPNESKSYVWGSAVLLSTTKKWKLWIFGEVFLLGMVERPNIRNFGSNFNVRSEFRRSSQGSGWLGSFAWVVIVVYWASFRLDCIAAWTFRFYLTLWLSQFHQHFKVRFLVQNHHIKKLRAKCRRFWPRIISKRISWPFSIRNFQELAFSLRSLLCKCLFLITIVGFSPSVNSRIQWTNKEK